MFLFGNQNFNDYKCNTYIPNEQTSGKNVLLFFIIEINSKVAILFAMRVSKYTISVHRMYI